MPKEVELATSEYGKLYVRVETYPGWSTYRARGVGIEFRGTTLGYAKDVIDILKRMLKAEAKPPEGVVKVARLLFEHIEAYTRHDILNDDFVGTSIEHENPESPYASYTLQIEVETLRIYLMDHVVADGREELGPDAPGWLVTIKATYEGYDGHGMGKHVVKRRVLFKDRVDTGVLWDEMKRVIRYAVNALPTE
jgi:hypothetical protein